MCVLFCVFLLFVCVGKIIRTKVRKKERRNYNKVNGEIRIRLSVGIGEHKVSLYRITAVTKGYWQFLANHHGRDHLTGVHHPVSHGHDRFGSKLSRP